MLNIFCRKQRITRVALRLPVHQTSLTQPSWLAPRQHAQRGRPSLQLYSRLRNGLSSRLQLQPCLLGIGLRTLFSKIRAMLQEWDILGAYRTPVLRGFDLAFRGRRSKLSALQSIGG